MMARTRRLLLILGILTMAGCSQDKTGPGEPLPQTADAVKVIPREVLFGNPDKASAQVSPDGKRLGYLAPVDGVLNVWVGPLDDPDAARPVTDDTHRGIRIFFFAYTSNQVLYLQDQGGDENWRVYCVDLGTGDVRDLTPLEGVQARILEVSPKFPEEVLIGLNDRMPQVHDVYRVNILTGERTLLQENPGFVGFVTDRDYQVRFGVQVTPDGGTAIMRPTGDGWEPFITISNEDNMTTSPLGFDKSGDILYMRDSRGRNTAALVSLNLKTGEQQVLASNERADIGGVIRHPVERTIQAVGFNYLRQQWEFFDLRVAADFDVLRSKYNGDVNLISRSYDDRHWIVAITSANAPVRYYHYDRDTREPTFLFTNRSEWEDLLLAEMHPVVIPARDGLEMVSYLTLPVWTDPDRDGRPKNPLPMVLMVHGGPWARDAYGPNPMHQWLANRGYAVLSVNFRGSTGFGKDFINAANREWGAKMHDDLIDAVNWAVDGRIADSEKVAIMGGSYGGYAALAGLTFTPDKFACAVDIVGPSNLVTLLESIPPYWAPMIEIFTNRVGDHRTEEGRQFLSQRSPLSHVDRISKPLLIGQGANDPRVKQAESDQIVEAMEQKQIPVTYVIFSDEGHGFARPENSLAFNAVAEAFLAMQLGGRSEPFGDDLKGSTIEVPEGADDVPGLTAALAGTQ